MSRTSAGVAATIPRGFRHSLKQKGRLWRCEAMLEQHMAVEELLAVDAHVSNKSVARISSLIEELMLVVDSSNGAKGVLSQIEGNSSRAR